MPQDSDREKTCIGAGPTEAFLVYDENLHDWAHDCNFIQWLRAEGFRPGDHHGSFGCSWIHVHLTRKLYAYGMPGIAVVRPIGSHAITPEEFKTIYAIYKKYEGLSLFNFPKQSENPEDN